LKQAGDVVNVGKKVGNVAFNCSDACPAIAPTPAPAPTPVKPGPNHEFEKAWRAQALKFAKVVQPSLGGANLQNLLAGLNTTDPHPPLGHSRNMTKKKYHLAEIAQFPGPVTHSAALRARSAAVSAYVTPTDKSCSDKGPGTKAQPLCTIPAGVAKCRSSKNKDAAGIVKMTSATISATLTCLGVVYSSH
jgi:hypothetical protein